MATTTYKGMELVAKETGLFRFAKPEGFTFEAGQTLDFTLIDPKETDAEGNMRTFSIASAPHEEDLMIATRLRDSAFKRTLRAMAPGDAISIDGPFGSFLLHENATRPAVFLAGGIGITPFYSMIKDTIERKLSHALILFYSNRTPEDAAFLTALTDLSAAHPAFICVPTMTELEGTETSWQGERGYIDEAMLLRHIPKDTMPIYYLAGPEKMVGAMRNMLASAGISRDDVRFEEFSGY